MENEGLDRFAQRLRINVGRGCWDDAPQVVAAGSKAEPVKVDAVLGEVLCRCFWCFERVIGNVCIGENPNMTIPFAAFRDALDAEPECGKDFRSSIGLSNGEK